jgi:acetyl esterase
VPIDPQVRAFLAAVAAENAPSTHEVTVAQARAGARSYAAMTGAPEDVYSVTHDFIPGPTSDLPIAIYRPEEAQGSAPVLVYFHGGGWMVANIAIVDSVVRSLANRTGCVVISVNYQKAPEHKFPTPMDDCFAAVKWIAEHAVELGVDVHRLAVGGDSAGGNLAAAVALRARDEGAPAIIHQLLVYPALQFGSDTESARRNGSGYWLDHVTIQYFWNQYVGSAEDGANPYCSPLLADDHHGLPPAMIVTAEFDPLEDEGRAYAGILEQAGVPVSLRQYDGMIHGFLWMAGVFDRTGELLNDIGGELRAVMNAASQPPRSIDSKRSDRNTSS